MTRKYSAGRITGHCICSGRCSGGGGGGGGGGGEGTNLFQIHAEI